jgi:hypothetical protein
VIERLGAKVIAMIVGAVLLVIGLGLLVHSCDVRRSKAAQSRVNQGQAGAFQNSSADAVNTISAAGDREAASEELTRQNERDIRNAQGANDAVNPAARDAGLRALCMRSAYRDDPKCRVFKPNPR